jgi:hypothetical protein|tara:strand:+ start:1366 stop:2274 length:909 start_codon:yes stop_codon:yes gene_type:complete
MEMFNKKVLKGRIGPLKKSDNLYQLEDIEGYFIRKCDELDIETSYDVMAEEMPYFKTLGYTEFATNFICQPLNGKIRTEQIMDAYNDNVKKPDDWVGYLKSNIKNKIANKYKYRKKNFDRYEDKDNLVVLPGSNKVQSHVCINKLKQIAKDHKDNIYFKPHPITTHKVIGELKDFFGEESILPRDIDMYYFLEKAKKVYSTHMSESVIYAMVLGKPIEPTDVWNKHHQVSFYHISKYLYDNQDNGIDWINKTFSSPKSGIINPNVDKDWKKKIDDYFDYIYNKREKYKGWYITKGNEKNIKK